MKTFRENAWVHIRKVLKSCDGNQKRAAKTLGISVRTIRNWVRRNERLVPPPEHPAQDGDGSCQDGITLP